MAACQPDALARNSKDFAGLPEAWKFNVLLYLFNQIAGVAIDIPNLVEESRCFCALQPAQKWNVLLWLACQFQGGGGKTCIVCLTGSDSPVDPPDCDCAIAYNMNSQFWFWDSGGATWMPILL